MMQPEQAMVVEAVARNDSHPADFFDPDGLDDLDVTYGHGGGYTAMDYGGGSGTGTSGSSVDQNSSPFQCLICMKTYKTQGSLQNHRSLYHRDLLRQRGDPTASLVNQTM